MRVGVSQQLPLKACHYQPHVGRAVGVGVQVLPWQHEGGSCGDVQPGAPPSVGWGPLLVVP